MAAGRRAGLELAVGGEGRTNVSAPSSLAASLGPGTHSAQPGLTGRVRAGGHTGPLKLGCLSLALKETKGLSEQESQGLAPFPINSAGLEGKGW